LVRMRRKHRRVHPFTDRAQTYQLVHRRAGHTVRNNERPGHLEDITEVTLLCFVIPVTVESKLKVSGRDTKGESTDLMTFYPRERAGARAVRASRPSGVFAWLGGAPYAYDGKACSCYL